MGKFILLAALISVGVSLIATAAATEGNQIILSLIGGACLGVYTAIMLDHPR